ncbi:response regulator [Antarcticibacterium flavum]|uniref:histidine kinase n=1 Tax=Antarcticibacterium flavum TaxID=2058175 RepID=A0A5B7X2S5_9FLAO|nr:MULTISPECIES: ATP-binding protein [Antarcticibacterium]MCM4159526.1 hybrid sensor histidine kinase/response regulator [Antarcticibacterium sp. W02-3]QCY69844.1 response regulator [Antarcticibacterium flavum]
MEHSRRSLTFKVIIGYLLVAILAGAAVWYTYNQVVTFTKVTQSTSLSNQQLVLVSEIATELYETESMGRKFIQSGDTTDLQIYNTQIEDIQSSINSLRRTYKDSSLALELDSITSLLSRKSENLEELLELRTRDRNTNYYREVIRELQKVDETFNLPNYDRRFANMEPHQRRVLIKLLEFSQEEQQISTVSADSLIQSVRQVLSELEQENQKFREVINKKENDLLVNDMVLNEQLRNLLRTIEQEEREISVARVEDSQELLNDIVMTIIVVGIACIIIILLFLFLIASDISRSQRYRMQLEEAKSFTEALMHRREQFIATITHDLRSPLNTVMGYTELMDRTDLSSKQEHYLGHLKKSTSYILHLVNDLLDLSKLEAGKMLVENLPFNPKNLLEDTFYNTIPETDNKNLKLTVEAGPETDCQVLSDPFRIKQILSNLIANAYKFTDSGEIKASISLEKKIEDSCVLIFIIKDTGIGISREKQKEIFEEFSQEHGEIEKKYGGTGLGLAITKRLAKLLQGVVELKSERGKGSEFIVKIPVKKVKTVTYDVPAPQLPEVDLTGKKVLVVDDESSQLALSKELIKSLGLKCETAPNGKEALKKLKNDRYHLVLTDIQMPVMDGFQLVEAIKANSRISHIPVVAISGRTNVPAEKYEEAGFAGNLLKPYKPTDLLYKIGEILKIELERKAGKTAEANPSITDYSLEEISMFAGDDRVALDTILVAFIDSTRLNLKDIKAAAKIDNWEKIAQIAHRMLPMFKQLKARDIIPKLELLEERKTNAFQNGELQYLIKEIDQFLLLLEQEVKA